jgi:hypothetical protein
MFLVSRLLPVAAIGLVPLFVMQQDPVKKPQDPKPPEMAMPSFKGE